ncbi:hypothetical protein J6590_098315 [Homalodisca vitripennis]|nr:hypothetical protein J6590_029298 [Homalodisca vitripennis]KAG8260381.1 hypothetical protein J6590_098315 [Homalodisca vitripennis]
MTVNSPQSYSTTEQVKHQKACGSHTRQRKFSNIKKLWDDSELSRVILDNGTNRTSKSCGMTVNSPESYLTMEQVEHQKAVG